MQWLTFDDSTLLANETLRRRRGRPKNSWIKETVKFYWHFITTDFDPSYKGQDFDPHNHGHTDLIYDAAREPYLPYGYPYAFYSLPPT